MVDSLLNSLEAERHLRAPLLEIFIDQIAADPELERARRSAQDLLETLSVDALSHQDFVRRIGHLRRLCVRQDAA